MTKQAKDYLKTNKVLSTRVMGWHYDFQRDNKKRRKLLIGCIV